MEIRVGRFPTTGRSAAGVRFRRTGAGLHRASEAGVLAGRSLASWRARKGEPSYGLTGIPMAGQMIQTKRASTTMSMRLAGIPATKNSRVVNCLLV